MSYTHQRSERARMVWRRNSFPVNIFVGSTFIYRYVRGVLPSVWIITHRGSRHVRNSAIRRKSEKSTNSVVVNDMLTVTVWPKQGEIRVAQQTVIPPTLESFVPVLFTETCPVIVKSKQVTLEREQVMVSRAVANILQLFPFHLSVTNVSKKSIYPEKHMVLAQGAESQTIREQPSGPSEPIYEGGKENLVHYPSEIQES